MNKKAKKIKPAQAGILFTVIGGISWGFSGACGQFLFQNYNVPSAWLSSARMLFAGIILIIFGFIKYKKRMISIFKKPKDILRLVLFSVFGLMFCQYAYMTAISYSNAGTATVLQSLGPIFITFTVCIRQKRPPRLKEAIAIVLALAGTFLLATHGNLSSLVITKEGLIFGLLAALGVSLYTLLSEKIVGEYGAGIVTGYGMLIGGIVLGTITGSFKESVDLDASGILALLAIIIIGTVIAYTFYLQGVGMIGPVKASLISSLEPVSAAVFAAIWLKTAFAPLDIAAFVMILATVFILSERKPENV